MHHVTEAILATFGSVRHLFNLRTVAETDGRSGGVNRHTKSGVRNPNAESNAIRVALSPQKAKFVGKAPEFRFGCHR
jgi:hypothetical protein